MARYTVIGAGGFIGSRVVQTLVAEGVDVVTPGRDEDLTGGDLGRVFYCAGLTGDYRSRPFDTVDAHVGLLTRVLDQGRFDRLVYLSSTRVYDGNPDALGREDAALRVNPNDPEQLYELTKLLGENLVVNRCDGRGAVARLSYVFDWTPGATGFLSDALRRAAKTRKLSCDSRPSDGRDYIHLDNAVAGLRAVLDSDFGGIVNVASGKVVSNASLAETFTAAGWHLAFTMPPQDNSQQAPDVERLAALGVRPSDVLSLISGYLKSLRASPR